MIVNAYVVNAFTKNGVGGNPAGVVLDASGFDDSMMQSIATTLCHPETAFVVSADENKKEFHVRYFTPVEEVDLCGHATIATFHLLKERARITDGEYKLKSAAGKLDVWVDNSKVVMQQAKPKFFKNHPKTKLAKLLGLDFKEIHQGLPCQEVSTGLKDVMIPVRNLDALSNIKPDMKEIKEYCAEHDIVSLHAFSLETKNKKAIAQCRNFAPLYGIPEEAATGTSNGALASYLYNQGVVDEQKAKKMRFEQGYSMNNPSEIFVELSINEGDISSVRVGGFANIAV
ncbi:MAG: PhzF family phenazine biosynthesis protein [Alphaproteobacteria bacterium]|nr:PhzF family phenazine biosynthesis protein [Alphaproteobacteria bacterium]